MSLFMLMTKKKTCLQLITFEKKYVLQKYLAYSYMALLIIQLLH